MLGMVHLDVKRAEIFENGPSCAKMLALAKTEGNEVQCLIEEFQQKQKSK